MMQNPVVAPKMRPGRKPVLSDERELELAAIFFAGRVSARRIAEEFSVYTEAGTLSAAAVRKIAKRRFADLPQSKAELL